MLARFEDGEEDEHPQLLVDLLQRACTDILLVGFRYSINAYTIGQPCSLSRTTLQAS